jgi:hypothetical protein
MELWFLLCNSSYLSCMKHANFGQRTTVAEDFETLIMRGWRYKKSIRRFVNKVMYVLGTNDNMYQNREKKIP